jgi:hypothetical protein
MIERKVPNAIRLLEVYSSNPYWDIGYPKNFYSSLKFFRANSY